MTIVIQNDFQMPATAKTTGKVKYPFASLEVGQGFTVEGDAAKLRSAASALSRFKSDNPTVVIEHGHEEGKLHVRRAG